MLSLHCQFKMIIMEENYIPGPNNLVVLQDDFGNIENVRAFSDFCEATCVNLFAYSPFQLRIDREQFLLFQNKADELKERLKEADVSVKDLIEVCCCLKDVYLKLMNDCWEAYIESGDSRTESGKFVTTQHIEVRLYNNRVKRQEMQ